MTDARFAVGFPRHPKTRKLRKRLGDAGPWGFVCLVLWVRENRPSGDLGALTDEDLELAADWCGEPGAFVLTLAAVGYLDGDEGHRVIHDWEEHNPYAASQAVRSEAGRTAALARWAAVKGNAESCDAHAMRKKAHSPLPNHTKPIPNQEKEMSESEDSAAACPITKIVSAYHELLPELPKCQKLTSQRAAFIRQRWREDMPELEHWRNFFRHVGKSDFLNGRTEPNNGRAPFVADLEWLTRPSNFAKIAEGKYHR